MSEPPREAESGVPTLLASLTVDVERDKRIQEFDSVRSDVDKILDSIRPFCRGTFFVTGEIANKSPGLVHAIKNEGHEVACHGLYHETFDTLSRIEQIERIDQATAFIENATGSRPRGFRAPYHRANADTILALEQLGYEYDSSVLPRTPFMRPQAYKKWRFLFAPTRPYHPSRRAIHRRGDCRVLEVPCSTIILPFVSKLSMRTGYASDLLARLLVRRASLQRVPIVYCLHSYDSSLSNGDLSWLRRIVSTLLQHNATFVTMSQVSRLFHRNSQLVLNGGP